MTSFLPFCFWAIILASCYANRRRDDPNYLEEYKQVYDAKLKAISVISCGLQKDLKANLRLPQSIMLINRALESLNFGEHEILVCSDMQSSFQNRTGLKSRMLPTDQAVMTDADVLFTVDSSASRNRVSHRSEGDGYDSTKLSIHVDLNFQQRFYQSDTHNIYDGVLLSSHSEVQSFAQSYSATSSWEKIPFPTPFLARAVSVDIQNQITAYLTREPPTVIVEAANTRNNSISALLPDILSPDFGLDKDTKWILSGISKLSARPDHNKIDHVYILYAACAESLDQMMDDEENTHLKIEAQLLRISDYVTNFLAVRQITFSLISYSQENFSPSSSSRYVHKINRPMEITRALLLSSVAWIRLPLSLNAQSSPKEMVLKSFSGGTTDEERHSNVMLSIAEEFLMRAALHGCVSFVLMESALRNASSTQLKEGISLTNEIKLAHRWLSNDVSSFSVHSPEDLAIATARKVFSLSPHDQRKSRLAAVGGDAASRLSSDLGSKILDGVIGSTFRRFTHRIENIAALRNLTSNFSASSPSTSYSTAREQSALALGRHVNNSYFSNVMSTTFAAIIIEPRFDPNFEFCVRNVMYHLGDKWGLLVFHSTGVLGNEKYVRHALRNFKGVEFVPLEYDLVYDGNSYNQMLMSVEFWRNLKFMKLLTVFIFQTDSVMLRRGIEQFMHWDYIGAPWHMMQGAESGKWLRHMQRGGSLKQGVGNGGTSLRSVSAMLDIAMNFKGKSRGFNEDTFFSFHCEKMGVSALKRIPHPKGRGCLLADRETAYSFAVEMPIAAKDINMTISDVAAASSNASVPKSFVPLTLHSTWAYADIALSLKLLRLAVLSK